MTENKQLLEDIRHELNEVFESENINDLINFCKQWCENGK